LSGVSASSIEHKPATPGLAFVFKKAAISAFVALVLFSLMIGIRTDAGPTGQLTYWTRFGELASLVVIVFAGSIAIELVRQWWGPARTASLVPASVQGGLSVAGRLLAPALLIFTFLVPVIFYNQRYILDLGILVLTYVMLGWGLNVVVGLAGLLDLGYAAFYAVGAYSYALLATSFGLSFWVCLPLAGILASLWGVMLGFPVLRLRGDYLAIVTLGFGEIIRVILQNMQSVGGARGLSVNHGWTNLFWAFGLAAVTVYVVASLINSTYGRGFIAVRDDEVAAEAMGINTTKYKVTAFVVGAFFAGIAGGLYAHSKQFVTPGGFGFMQSIAFVVMVILGGMGNTIGVIIAAVLLTLLPEGLRMLSGIEHLPGLTAERPLGWIGDTRMIIYSLLLIVLMLTRPQGLFSLKKTPAPK